MGRGEADRCLAAHKLGLLVELLVELTRSFAHAATFFARLHLERRGEGRLGLIVVNLLVFIGARRVLSGLPSAWYWAPSALLELNLSLKHFVLMPTCCAARQNVSTCRSGVHHCPSVQGRLARIAPQFGVWSTRGGGGRVRAWHEVTVVDEG